MTQKRQEGEATPKEIFKSLRWFGYSYVVQAITSLITFIFCSIMLAYGAVNNQLAISLPFTILTILAFLAVLPHKGDFGKNE